MVTRGAGAALMAELAKPAFHPAVLAFVDWPGAPVRVHLGRGSIAWGGHDWLGVWRFGEIALPQEVGGLAGGAATIRLISDPALIFAEIEAALRNREVGIWLGAATERAGNVLIGAPVQAFSGHIDAVAAVIVETEEGEEHAIEITAATGPPARAMASIYHSDADQRRHYPADTAGRLLINNLARTARITWPEN